ncbi:DUF4333 domain-containing protein [Gulosibacter molinativorax]|uniref:DUF4333 domain-containing protein n=1 Tax=Gulosibacter molinativorax TaxID=256821 RepID=A0ABT7C6C4_9MICO|nr:DUF4333 domain-containing protein [Gulosibacter molinativorax]MDJ1370761.1 DUF4333 domain-containing protein [Gulosibacter molinativorax]QUY63212.1 Hypotetical protein [Gulosibacter molinativorax]
MTHTPTDGASDDSREPQQDMPKLPDLDASASPSAAFQASAGVDSQGASGTGTSASSSSGWNGPGTNRPAYRAGSTGQDAGGAGTFRPTSYSGQSGSGQSGSGHQSGGYAGQSHAQYGQPNRPQPQYGQPQPYPSYGTTHTGSHTSAHPGTSQVPVLPGPANAKRDRKRGRGARATVVVLSLLLPIGIAAGAIAGYTYADQMGSYSTQAVEREVVAVLRDDYGLSDLSEVQCPAWIKVEQGESFQCEFEYAGATQTVTVTQGSQSGQLVVGAPE